MFATKNNLENIFKYLLHYVENDHTTAQLSNMPKIADLTQIHTEFDSLAQERLVDQISSIVDRRDVRYQEKPLHLVVCLNDVISTRALALFGWNSL